MIARQKSIDSVELAVSWEVVERCMEPFADIPPAVHAGHPMSSPQELTMRSIHIKTQRIKGIEAGLWHI